MYDETIISACSLGGIVVSSSILGDEINSNVFTNQLMAHAETSGGSGTPAPTGVHNDLTGRDATNSHPDTAIALSTTYTGNLTGLTTQKDVNDFIDADLPQEKRTEWVSLLLMYQAFAPQGSAENEAVWTIYKIVTLATGGVVSNTEFTNKKWTERNLL